MGIHGETMKASDVITGSLATCYVTIGGERYKLMNIISLEATMKRNITEVSIMGQTAKGHKANGWSGSGNMTMYYNTSVFRKIAMKYQDEGKSESFEIVITNEDPSSEAGEQIIILKNCIFEEMIIAKMDAGSETLEEDMSFTFDACSLEKAFTLLVGMK